MTIAKSEIPNPKSLLVVISVGEKTIEKCYANQCCHNDYIGNAFGVQHIILKGVDGFHSYDLIQLLILVFYGRYKFSDLIPLEADSS